MYDQSYAVENPHCPPRLIYFVDPSNVYREPLIEWPYKDSKEAAYVDSYSVVIKSVWEYEELYIPHNFVLGTE